MPLGCPTTPAAFKFTLNDIFVVALGVCSALEGMVMFPVGPLVFTTPFCADQPCTI